MFKTEAEEAAEIAEAEAKAQAEAEEKEKADAEFEASLEGLSEEEQTEKRAEKEAKEREEDYEAYLEAEKKRREKAESSAQYHRQEAERLRKEREGFVTKEDLKELEASLTRATQRSQVNAEIKRIASTPKEAELILYHYEHSLVPTGDIITDVQRAHLLANERRLKTENEELQAALQSKENRGQGVRGGARMEDETKEPQLDADTKNLIRLNRMAWDSKLKKFKNERGVTFDPKTGIVTDPRRK